MLSSETKEGVTKFSPKYNGLYKILEVIGPNLKIVNGSHMNVVSIDHVRVYKSKAEYPDLIDYKDCCQTPVESTHPNCSRMCCCYTVSFSGLVLWFSKHFDYSY